MARLLVARERELTRFIVKEPTASTALDSAAP